MKQCFLLEYNGWAKKQIRKSPHPFFQPLIIDANNRQTRKIHFQELTYDKQQGLLVTEYLQVVFHLYFSVLINVWKK